MHPFLVFFRLGAMNTTRGNNPFAQRFAPAFANHWRRWLYALMAVLLLSSFIELAHDHSAHKAREAANCAICQHSVSFDKTLPNDIPVILLALGFCLTVSTRYQQPSAAHRFAFRSRAPPVFSA